MLIICIQLRFVVLLIIYIAVDAYSRFFCMTGLHHLLEARRLYCLTRTFRGRCIILCVWRHVCFVAVFYTCRHPSFLITLVCSLLCVFRLVSVHLCRAILLRPPSAAGFKSRSFSGSLRDSVDALCCFAFFLLVFGCGCIFFCVFRNSIGLRCFVIYDRFGCGFFFFFFL